MTTIEHMASTPAIDGSVGWIGGNCSSTGLMLGFVGAPDELVLA